MKEQRKVQRVYEHLGHIVLSDGVTYRFLNKETYETLRGQAPLAILWEIAIQPHELVLLLEIHTNLPPAKEAVPISEL